MFFVWTGGGFHQGRQDPMQMMGMVLFFMQVLPRMFPDISAFVLLSLLMLPAVLLMAWACLGPAITTRGEETIHERPEGPSDAITTRQQIRQTIFRARDAMRQSLNRMSGVEWSDEALWGVVIGFVMSLGYFTWQMDAHQLSIMSQLLGLGLAIYSHFHAYGPGAGGNRILGRPRRRSADEERRQRQARMQEIAEHIQGMATEEFLPLERISDCTVMKLKQMLARRGVTTGELETFVEKQNLQDRLKEVRKYSDVCCICLDAFEVGDPLRVLPKCHHELHVECLDKWAFTFAGPSKRSLTPNCPLCKEHL